MVSIGKKEKIIAGNISRDCSNNKTVPNLFQKAGIG
jgi:hypothetical protein